MAGGAVLARVALALVDVQLAGRAVVARRALALVGVYLVDAGGVVLARDRGALVDVDVAVVAGVAGLAEALVRPGFVDADAVTAQRLALLLALVYVLSAGFASVTRLALAPEVDVVDRNAVAVATVLVEAHVDNLGAVGLSGTLPTAALVLADAVDADPLVWTHDPDAVVDVDVANLALEAVRALADELALRRRREDAGAVVLARTGHAGVVLALAVVPGPVLGAVAAVALGLVDAGAAVLTGLGRALVHVHLAVFT